MEKLCVCVVAVLAVLLMAEASPARISDDTVEIGGFGNQNVGSEKDDFDARKICVLPAKRGHCRALLLRWRYDPAQRDCVEFKFGGCDGNGNNFQTKKQCMRMCNGI